MALAPGQRLGPYRLEASLGSGGMGEVFLARDERLERLVAIKALREDVVASAPARQRLLREARAAACINHPNVAAVFDILEDHDPPLLVMEYVEGETLAARARRAPVDPAQIVAIGRQLAEGVAAAHAQGVVHRDLKPSNIVLTAGGRVKILDFGIARVGAAGATPAPAPGSGDTWTHGFVGTPRYAAPEQLAGGEVDARADVFSIGAVLYELAAGRPAFDARSPLDAAVQVLTTAPPPLAAVRPDVPPALAAVIEKALRPRAAERHQSAADLARALGEASAALASAPTRSLPARRAPVAWRPFIAAAALVASAVGTGVQTVRSKDAAAGGRPVVAVVSLASATGHPQEGHLGVGIADVLTTSLAGVPGLVVIARSGTRGYAGGDADARRIARELGASFVVGGSVQRAADRLLVSVVLSRADGWVVWGDRAEGPLDDLFALQRRLADGVARAVVHTLGPAIPARPGAAGAIDAVALAAYAEGRTLLERADVAGNTGRAIDAFRRAMERDPSFALARAGFVDAAWQRYRETGDAAWADRAVEASREALRLDPYQADVLVSLAGVYNGTGRHEEARQALERAIRLQPRHDEAFRALGETLAAGGRPAEARAAYERAIDLRPAYWRHHYRSGVFLFGRNDLEGARREFERVTELVPDSPAGHQALGRVYQTLDDLPRARQAYERALARGFSVSAASNLGALLHWEGRYHDAIALYERAIEAAPAEPLFHRNAGDAWLRLGDRARAQAAYERAVALAEAQLVVNPASAELLATLAVYEAKAGRFDRAAQHLEGARSRGEETADIAYAEAIVCTLEGRNVAALEALGRAFDLGYSRTLAARDDDLAAVRQMDGYRAIAGGAAGR
jgi:tetratricopeptide (TPR) repeat protein/TolB-like protein